MAKLLIEPTFAYCLLKYSWLNIGGLGEGDDDTKFKTVNENIYILKMLFFHDLMFIFNVGG